MSTALLRDLLEALDAVVELAMPRRCAGCDEPRTSLCERCLRELATILRDTPVPVRPSPCPPGFPTTWAMTAYDGAVAALITEHKDNGRHDLAPVLGRILRASLAASSPTDAMASARARGALVVPAPSSAAATRERGRSPLADIAAHATRGRGPVVIPALRMGRRVRDQAGLDSGQRALNLAGSMRVRGRFASRIRGRSVVVVDDVVTTGATLVECRRALLEAGATDVGAAVIAATARRR